MEESDRKYRSFRVSGRYNNNGQKAKETAAVVNEEGKTSKKTTGYTYDLLGRLTKETKTDSEDISYTYDNHNNRKEITVGNKTTVYKYNQNDELLRTDTLNSETEENSVVIYKNDKNGNQLATVNRYEIPENQKSQTYIDVDGRKEVTMNHKVKIIIKRIFVGMSLAFYIYILFIFYKSFFSIDGIEGEQLIKKVKSPNNRYEIHAFVNNGGGTTDYAVLGVLVDLKSNIKKNIFWDYHCDNVEIRWKSNEIVLINNIELHIPNDVYDYRKYN